MDDILIISHDANDLHLIDFARRFAYQNDKQLTVAQLSLPSRTMNQELVPVKINRLPSQSGKTNNYSEHAPDFDDEVELPEFKTINASRFTERQLAAYVHRHNFSMVISRLKPGSLDLQQLLNQLHCPLMLLPQDVASKTISRTVYLTDLRYCQLPVLANLVKLKISSLLLAHISLKGLPDLVPTYSNTLFADCVGRFSTQTELFFSHIKEKKMQKVTDTLINTMRADMLVCQNRGFHFQQMLGEGLPAQLPQHVSVPLLIYPC